MATGRLNKKVAFIGSAVVVFLLLALLYYYWLSLE